MVIQKSAKTAYQKDCMKRQEISQVSNENVGYSPSNLQLRVLTFLHGQKTIQGTTIITEIPLYFCIVPVPIKDPESLLC